MTDKEFAIRSIKATDNEGIFKLIQGILESYDLDKPGTAYFDPYLDKLYESYQEQPKGEYWVIVKDDKVYGGIGISPFGDYENIAEVQKYYISKDIRGLGYGRKLYDIAEKFAKEQGYDSLYIETIDILGIANDVYYHYGFDQRDKPLNGSEHSLMNVWLEKRI